jgi:hypothetical protein
MKQGDQIKMNTMAAGPFGVFNIGQVLTVGQHVDVKTAKTWINGRYAEKYTAPPPKQTDQAKPETKQNPEKDVDERLTENVLRRTKKADLLAICAEDQFNIQPPDGATNNVLVDLILAALNDEPTGGYTDPIDAIEKALRGSSRDDLIIMCDADHLNLEHPIDATAVELVELILATDPTSVPDLSDTGTK